MVDGGIGVYTCMYVSTYNVNNTEGDTDMGIYVHACTHAHTHAFITLA